MTIEKVNTSSEAKPSSASETKAGKGKATTPGDATSGGFSALMSELEESSESAAVQPPAETPLPAVQADLASAVLAAQLNVPAPDVADDTALDAAALLAQSIQQEPVSPENIMWVADGLTEALPSPVTAGAMARVVSVQTVPQVSQSPAETGHATHTLHKLATYRLEQSLNKNQVFASQASASGSVPSLDVVGQHIFEKKDFASFVPAPIETIHMAMNATVRREERGADHAIFKMNALESTCTPNVPPIGVATASALGVPILSSNPEIYVAEQVKYWISNDVKNAELQLDGLGDGPVEVSISMQGNEAQVAFRTDEVRAREALENASAHLREMLQREGLVLSGVSVGTADTGDTGAQERKGVSVARKVQITPGAVMTAPLQPVPSRASGRTLDIFV